MTGRADTIPPSDGTRHFARALTVDYLFSGLGLFTILPTLPILIEDQTGAAGAVGISLAVLNIASRVGGVGASPLLERLPPKGTMVVSLLLPGVGFSLLGLATTTASATAALLLCGLGFSINAILGKGLAAVVIPTRPERVGLFARINVAVNVAAAAGPVAGAYLYVTGKPLRLTLVCGGLFVAAALAVGLLMPRTEQKPGRTGDGSFWRRLVDLGRQREMRRVAIVSCLGWFLYAQLFSALPLYATATLGDHRLAATLFTANALIIIALQIPLGRLSNRLVESGTTPLAVLLGGTTILAFSMVLIAMSGWVVGILYVGVAVFTVGEMAFTPMVDTAFSDMATGDAGPVAIFNYRQVAAAIGEATGSFVGATAALTVFNAESMSVYWLFIGIVGVAGGALGFVVLGEYARSDNSNPQAVS